jgi:hypothetical protein
VAELEGETVAHRVRRFSCRPASVTAARGFVREMLREQAQELLEPSGRGLRIVQALSQAWGVVPGEDGTRVWFTLARGDGARTLAEPLRCSR